MIRFRLIGRSTVFVVVREYLAAGLVPAIVGVTEDGRYQTIARKADVAFFAGAAR